GTVVEDQLYEFGKLQTREHPSQFFIFNVNNSELYIKHGTFTSGESEEIMTNYNNITSQLPEDFKQYLNKFNCKSTVDIRKAFLQKESWEDSYDQDKHFDLDWIKQSIHMLLQEGEGVSVASVVIKTTKRTLVDVYNSARKNMGRRFDFLIRENHPKSTTSLEYGAAEVAKNYDLNSNKMIIEACQIHIIGLDITK
ncbi:uncharacterized protein EV154DRAFT_409819, partial [Mucor mucedo]|uniref:uncharacterized protein n=1 Tax=Mucor mucedo TaxID=29922 RepID=UPI00221F2185